MMTGMGVKAAVRKARMSVSEAMTIDGPACEIVSVHTVRVRHDRGQSESWLSSETQPAHDIRAEGWGRTADAVLQVERVGRVIEGVLRPPQPHDHSRGRNPEAFSNSKQWPYGHEEHAVKADACPSITIKAPINEIKSN